MNSNKITEGSPTSYFAPRNLERLLKGNCQFKFVNITTCLTDQSNQSIVAIKEWKRCSIQAIELQFLIRVKTKSSIERTIYSKLIHFNPI